MNEQEEAMTIFEAKKTISDVVYSLKGVEQCKEDVEAFELAIKCMEYFLDLKNNLDVSYTLLSRHYQSGLMDEMLKLIKELENIK
jgi:hypothetical protein